MVELNSIKTRNRKDGVVVGVNQVKISRWILLVSVLSNILFLLFSFFDSYLDIGGLNIFRSIAILMLTVSLMSLIMIVVFMVKKRYTNLKKWQKIILWLYVVANILYILFVCVVVAVVLVAFFSGSFFIGT